MIEKKVSVEKESKIWYWLVILILVGLIALLIFSEIKDYKLTKNHRFTIAKTIGATNGGWVDFEFVVEGTHYKSSTRKFSLKSKDESYFVKYYAPDPSLVSEIVSDEIVPLCIGESPPNGWSKIPICKYE